MMRACITSGTRCAASRVCKAVRRFSTVRHGRLEPVSDRTTGDPSAKPEFKELNLRELDLEWQRVRVRQHVNPLKLSLQEKIGPLDWDTAFADPSKPLVVDVGSGYGRFMLQMALAYPMANCLGLEIREPIIERASEWAQAVGLDDRVQFKLANGTVSTKSMLSSYPGDVVLVCIQFPDPHFKRRHRKRHIVQPQFCVEVQEVLSDHGQVYAASDVREVAEYMHSVFATSTPDLKPASCLTDLMDGPVSTDTLRPELQSIWLEDNPLGVPTEREVHAIEKGIEIHRFMLQKQQASA